MLNYHKYGLIILSIIGWLLVIPSALANPALQITVDTQLVQVGETIQVTGFGAEVDKLVKVMVVYNPTSSAQAMATVEVQPEQDGTFQAEITIPEFLTIGRYAIRAEQPAATGTGISQYHWVGFCVDECIGEPLAKLVDLQDKLPVDNRGTSSDGNAHESTVALWNGVSVGGYASKVSVAQGESIDFHISTDVSTYSIDIKRWGVYPQLMETVDGLQGQRYGCQDGYATGCDWPVAYTLQVPSNWPSGIYTADIPTNVEGTRRIIFWVREDNPGSTGSILLLSSVNTYNAYANFGGKSTYESASSNNEEANKVSFNRPLSKNNDKGVGDFMRWREDEFASWIESEGYAVEYAADYDLEFIPDLLDPYDVVIILGHSEYWSWDMRQRAKAFINNGGRFVNLSGNTMWWQVRFEDNGRTMVVYKNVDEDPVDTREGATSIPAAGPIYDTEAAILGAHWQFGGYFDRTKSLFQHADGYGGFWVYRPDHWIYAGTGLRAGDVFGRNVETGREGVIGAEMDGTPLNCAPDGQTILGPIANSGVPHNLNILALSPAYRGKTGLAPIGIYTNEQGGAVFSANTIGWGGAILEEEHVGTITRNVLDRFLAGDFPAEQPLNSDTDYLFYDRFNCNNLYHNGVKASYDGPAWYNGVGLAEHNYIKSYGNPYKMRFTNSCGVDGPGLEIDIHNFSLGAQLYPNWESASVVHSQAYFDFSNMNLVNGDTFHIIRYFHLDNVADTKVDVARLSVQLENGQLQMQFVDAPSGNGTQWVNIPKDRPFMVEVMWDNPNNEVAIWIDGQLMDRQTVSIARDLFANFAEFALQGLDNDAGGKLCIDELIHDESYIGGKTTPQYQVTIDSHPDVAAMPGETVVLNHTLINEGSTLEDLNFTAQINPSDWTITNIQPENVSSLGSGESVDFQVEVSVPSTASTTTLARVNIVAQIPTQVLSEAVDRISVQSVPDVSLTEGQTDEIGPGETIYLIHTLTNEGNGTDSFGIEATVDLAGWEVSTHPSTIGPLAPGQSSIFKIKLIAPAEASLGTEATVNMVARSKTDSQVEASVVDKAVVTSVPAVKITSAANQEALPGEVVTFSHNVINQGNGEDSFAVDVEVIDHEDWAVEISSSLIGPLAAGETAELIVQITVPETALFQEEAKVKIEVTSQLDSVVSDTTRDWITVKAASEVSITPKKQTRVAEPEQTITFNHTIINQGNKVDTFALNATADLGWIITIQPSTINDLGPGESAEVELKVYTPAEVDADTKLTIDVEVQSTTSEAVDRATDFVVADGVFGVELSTNSLVTALPGEEIVFTHTLTNIGNIEDVYTLELQTSDKIADNVTLSVLEVGPLASGESSSVMVTVNVPEDFSGNSRWPIKVRAISQSDPQIVAVVEDMVTIKATHKVEFAPPQRVRAQHGSRLQLEQSITNRGNVEESFILNIEKPDGWQVNSSAQIFPNVKPGETVTFTIEVEIPKDSSLSTAADEIKGFKITVIGQESNLVIGELMCEIEIDGGGGSDSSNEGVYLPLLMND